MTIPREPSRLARLKAQYRQVILRDEVRDNILRTIDQHLSSELEPTRSTEEPSRSRVVMGAAAVFALATAVLLVLGLRRPQKLEAVVSAVSGQALSDGENPRVLVPDVRVSEGQRLRTFASSALETRVGKHLMAVSSDSSLWIESLRPQDLRFRLERGQVTWTVSPLGPGGRLHVLAGDLSVEVVGTVFSVERNDECSSVWVRSGRVAIAHKGITGEVRAGESRRFCPALATVTEPLPTERESAGASTNSVRDTERMVAGTAPTTLASSVQKGDERPLAPVRRLASVVATSPAGHSPVRAESLSEEERLFRDASRGDRGRGRRLQDYLARFPDGTFTEDALFQFIRLSYTDGDAAEVVRLSDQFLRRYHRGRRAIEVQLLYVQSSIELGLPPSQSLLVLESMLPHLGSLSRSQREQAIYLAILAYCGSPETQSCGPWIDRYLEEFPQGIYAPRVRRSHMERANRR